MSVKEVFKSSFQLLAQQSDNGNNFFYDKTKRILYAKYLPDKIRPHLHSIINSHNIIVIVCFQL